ncbi:MAG: hypothetical protein JWN44_5634 [Myxococcales bacterium]|nr:hypothetical protein [Myxococcales bacterium]
MRRASKLLRLATLLALRVTAGLLILVLALVVALRTAPGRRALVHLLLPIVNRSLAGHIQLASLDGNFGHSLIVRDLKIDDPEGVQALFARRIEVHYDLSALWRHTVQIDDLDVEGAEVLIRHLKDNRVNFAALPASSSSHGEASSSPSEPPRLVVKHLRLRFDGGYDPPVGHETHALERPRGSFDIEGSADIRGADVTVHVDHLISDARDPLAAHVEVRGGLKVDPPRGPGGHTELTFSAVTVSVAADGRQIERINPGLKAAGLWKVNVDGGGPLSALLAHVVIAPPTGTLVADGTLARTWPGVKWSAHAVARGLQPADDWRGLARGLLELDVAGHGDPAGGEVEVERFDGVTGDLRVHASGKSDFTGAGNGAVVITAGDLRRLAAMGLPGLAGKARISAELRRAGSGTRFAGELHATALRLPGARLGGVDARWSSRDWSGTIEIAARQLETAQLSLAALSLSGQSDGQRLHSRIDVRAIDDGLARVELRATPRRDSGRVTGADVIIDELVASSKRGRFQLPSAAHLHLFGTFAAPSVDGELAGLLVRLRGRSTADDFIADLSVDGADLSSLSPRLGGRLHLTAHAVKGAQLRVDAELHGSGLGLGAAKLQTLDARVHAVDLAGTVHVTADHLSAPGFVADALVLDGKSDAQRLSVTLGGHGPAHSTLALAVDGRYLRRAERLVGAELTVRELTVAAGGQSWALERPALVRVDSTIAVDRFVLVSLGQSLGVEGRYRLASGAIDLTLLAHDIHPASFAKMIGVKEALSVTTVNGRVHVSGSVHAPVLRASIKAASDKKVEWYGLSFNTLSFEASAARETLLVHVNGGGAGSGRFALDVHGAPLWNGDQLIGAEATLDRLRLSANDHVWQAAAPCKLRFDNAVSFESCKLVAGKEEIAINGRIPFVEGPMDATLVTHELDLRELGAFLAPGHKELPTTSFNVRVHASGTRQAPLVDLELRGHGSQIDEGLPENVDYRVRAHYGDGRIAGEVSARQLGTKLGIGGRFDLPISFAQADDKPLHLEIEARPVPFFKIRDSLPPAIAGLRGFFTLRVRASGTTRHPLFNAELHAPSWDLDDLTNNDTVINLTYDGALLRLNSVTSFAATSFIGSILRIRPKRNAGTVTVEGKVPIDVARLLSKPREALDALAHTAQLTASAEIKGVELQGVPLQVIGFATPFTTGLVDGAINMSGTLHAPSLHARLHASGLSRPGLVDQVDIDATFAFERNLARLNGKLDLRKQPLFAFQGEADLDAQKLFDGEGWREGSIRGELELPRFELAALRGMQPRLARIAGTVSGKGALRGTFAAPELLVDLRAAALYLGGDRFEAARAEARYRDRRFSIHASAAQAHGGSLVGEASWSHGSEDPLAVSIRARRLDIGFLATASEEVSSLSGQLDAELTIGGTRAAPRPDGFLSIHRANLGLRGKADKYRDGELDVRTGGGRAKLTLDVKTGDGSLTATGEARIDGVQPTRVDLTAHAQKFALVYGSFAAKLDADFGLVGDRASGQWTGRVDLRRGTINLPDLSGGERVQPLGEMGDVSFGDQRAERIAQPKAGKGHWVVARIVGPVEIRGHEANLDLVSDLALTIVPGKTTAVGTVKGSNGTVALFGKPYHLEQAEVRFSGPLADPALHVRATRRAGEATLIVTVGGSALNPEVALTVDPPIYDQAQLAGLVLAGSTRRSADAISFRDLNRQIGGLLSNVILHKIKEQLAALVPTETFEPVDNKSDARFSLSPLEVGRYVSDRVYISYEHQFGASIGRSAANANESQIKVRLPYGGELDSAVGDAGVAGVYLYWNYRY